MSVQPMPTVRFSRSSHPFMWVLLYSIQRPVTFLVFWTVRILLLCLRVKEWRSRMGERCNHVSNVYIRTVVWKQATHSCIYDEPLVCLFTAFKICKKYSTRTELISKKYSVFKEARRVAATKRITFFTRIFRRTF